MATRLTPRLMGLFPALLVTLLLASRSLGAEPDGAPGPDWGAAIPSHFERIPGSHEGGFLNESEGFSEWSVGAGWDSPPVKGIHELLDVYNVDRLKRILDVGGHGNLSDACAEDALEFANAWKAGKPWAMALSDSSGRYSSQFFIGDGFWLGSIILCGSLDPDVGRAGLAGDPSSPPPRLSSIEHSTSVREKAPYAVSFVTTQLHMNLPEEFQPSERVITLGLCLPKSCVSNQNDTKLFIRYLSGANETEKASEVPKGSGVKLTVTSVRKVPGDYAPLKDSTFVTLLITAAVLVLLMASGTALDVMDRRLPANFRPRVESKMDWMSCAKPENNLCSGKPVMPECNGNHLTYVQGAPPADTVVVAEQLSEKKRSCGAKIASNVKGVLLCFSLRYNVPKLFEKPPLADHSVGPCLACLHGLRVFSLVWVITGHACLVAMNFVENKSFRGIVEKDFLFQSVSNGAFSVDTFFFISGLLLSYLFIKAIAQPSANVVKRSIKSDFIKFVGVLTYRFIRLTPTYLVAIGMVEVTSRWLLDGSVFPPPTYDHELCPKYWWRNILYINTFYPVDQMCMVWSWYLADDTQFYTLGVLLLLLSTRHFRTAVTTGSLILVSSWFTTGIITYIAKHSPSIEDPFSLFDELYDKPWTRLGPYMVGMVVGYLLTQEIVYKKMSKVVSGLIWLVFTSLSFSLVYGLYGRKIGPWESAAHTALSHTTWGLSIGWIVISCATGKGGPVNAILSNRVFVPFSRLSFCAYLVHPIVMFAVYMHSDAAYHLTRDSMVMTIGGFILASYLLAFVVSMSVEAPSIRLLEYIHPIKKKLREEEERSNNASSTELFK